VVKVTVAGTQTVIVIGTYDLAVGTAYSLAVGGTVAGKSVKLIPFVDNLAAPAKDTAHMRLYHLAPTSPAFAVDTVSTKGRTNVVKTIEYGKATDTFPLPVPPSKYDMLFLPLVATPRKAVFQNRDNTASSSGSLIPVFLHEANLESCKVYSKFLFGPNTDLKLYAVVYAPAGGCSGGLPISTDGSCGAGRAMCYPEQPCCSKYGYCGSGIDYVGTTLAPSSQ